MAGTEVGLAGPWGLGARGQVTASPSTHRWPSPAPLSWVLVAGGAPGSMGQAGAEIACTGERSAVKFWHLHGASRVQERGRRSLLCSPHFPGSEAMRTQLGRSSLMGSLPAGN